MRCDASRAFISSLLTLSAIIIEEPPWTPRTGSCVWTDRKSRIWAMASWSVPSANTMPWSRVRDRSSHTSEHKKHSALSRRSVCVCWLVTMRLTCVTMVFGSVWFILSVTTEISIGSPGRRGGRSSWSETCRVWPMTTATLRAGGFWEATGIIIWENRSNIQPATPIIPWKRRTHCWSLAQTQEVKLQERRQYAVHFMHRSSVLCHLDQRTHLNDAKISSAEFVVLCASTVRTDSADIYSSGNHKRWAVNLKKKKRVSLDWISLTKLKEKKSLLNKRKVMLRFCLTAEHFYLLYSTFFLCYSSNRA